MTLIVNGFVFESELCASCKYHSPEGCPFIHVSGFSAYQPKWARCCLFNRDISYLRVRIFCSNILRRVERGFRFLELRVRKLRTAVGIHAARHRLSINDVLSIHCVQPYLEPKTCGVCGEVKPSLRIGETAMHDVINICESCARIFNQKKGKKP